MLYENSDTGHIVWNKTTTKLLHDLALRRPFVADVLSLVVLLPQTYFIG